MSAPLPLQAVWPHGERRLPLPELEVLLAEESERLRGLLADVLRAEGYRVTEVGHGGALRELLAQRLASGAGAPLPDLVVCSAVLPELGGLALLGWLRERGLSLPVILLGGSAQEEDEALVRGAMTVLRRPVDIEDLLFAALVAAEPR